MTESAVEDLQVQHNPADDIWQSFVREHPLATPFHTLDWHESITATFDYQSARVLVTDQSGEVVAAVPGSRCPALLGSTVVNPFCEYGFPLVAEGVSSAPVLEALKPSVGRFGARLVKDADWTGVTGYRPVGFGAVPTGDTRRVPLSDFDTVRIHEIDRTVHQNVDRAREMGVTVTATADVAGVYECYLTAMRRHGSPQFPRRFLDGLLERFGPDCLFLVAELGDSPVASLVALDHGGERYLLLNGSTKAGLDARANDLLYWEAIRRACEAGYNRVDMGRTEPGSGVSQFKRGFGGRREQLTTLAWPPHRTQRGAISGYRRLQPAAQGLSSFVTHAKVGPRLKRWIHE